MFNCYIGVDYSGALTPTASLNGLRVYLAEGDSVPAEVARRFARKQNNRSRIGVEARAFKVFSCDHETKSL